MRKILDRLAPSGWLRQQLVRLISDSAIVSLGGGIAAVFGLIAFAISARIVSPAELGAMLLAQSAMFLVGRIFGLQGWNAFTRFGSEHIAKKEDREFRAALGRSLVVDVIGIAMAVTASLLTIYVNGFYGLVEAPPWLLLLFAGVNLAKFGGTAASVLRIYSITGPLAWPPVYLSIVKAAALLVVLYLGGDLFWVALIWAAHQFLMSAWPAIRCVRELSARRLLPIFAPWDPGRFRRSFRFAVATHLASLSSSLQEFDTVVIGYLMNSEGVAIYRLAKDTTLKLIRLLAVLTQLAYPVFAQLRFAGDGMLRRFGLRFLLFSFAIGAVLASAVAIGMVGLIPIAFPPEYAAALLPAVIFCAALPFEIVVRTGMPLLYSADRTALALAISGLAGLVYLALIALASTTGHITLVALAYLCCSVAVALCLCIIVWRMKDPGRAVAEASTSDQE
ncbi:MAG: lipopolysaccharide biosynthesis protein [Pseudomonadota bacterium]